MERKLGGMKIKDDVTLKTVFGTLKSLSKQLNILSKNVDVLQDQQNNQKVNVEEKFIQLQHFLDEMVAPHLLVQDGLDTMDEVVNVEASVDPDDY
jgi:flagellar capping protein FliD